MTIHAIAPASAHVDLRAIAVLLKLPISGLSCVSAGMGYVAFAHAVSLHTVAVCAGVLLLACAAGALNQLQERDRDALMTRTRARPLPAGVLTVAVALSLAVGLGTAGLLLLHRSSGLLAASLGLLAVVWYNGVYTYLKGVTPFASVPGAIIGALPPAIGWIAAGGGWSVRILSLCFFLFMWQVPHFWLLVLRLAPDYERAGVPALTGVFTRSQLSRLTFVWTTAAVAAALQMPLFVLARPFCGVIIAAGSLALLGLTPSSQRAIAPAWRRAFHAINLYALVVMTVVVVDALW